MSAVATPAPELGVPVRARLERERWTWAGLALVVVASTLLIYLEGHGIGFVRDDWNLILTRRGHSLDAFLRPHNLHLLAVQVLVYKALLQVFGLSSYAPYRAVSVVLHGLVVVLLFVFVRRRLGPAIALGMAAIFAFPGVASEEVFWAFQMGFLGSIAAGLGMLLMLERRDPRADLAASGLLLVAIACSGVGLAFALAAAVEVAAGGDRMRRAARVLLVPLALYGLWYLAYGGPVPRNLVPATEVPGEPPVNLFDNFLRAPVYSFDAAGAAVSALLGMDFQFGPALVIAALALLAARLLRGKRPPTGLWVALGLAVGYWLLVALARAQFNDYGAPRYLYPAAAFILLVVAEAVPRTPVSRRVAPWLVAAGAVVVVSNIGLLRGEANNFRGLTNKVLPRLTALELAGGRVDPGFRPFPNANDAAPDVVAGPYLAAIRTFGSPAPSPAELVRRPEIQLESADATLVAALGVRPVLVETTGGSGHRRSAGGATGGGDGAGGAGTGGGRGGGGPAPAVVAAQEGQVSAQGGCAVLQPDTLGAWIELRVPPTGLAVTSSPGGPILLRARQLAAAFGDPFAVIAPGRSAVIHFPPDGLAQPWYVRIDSVQQVRACGRVG